jgi:hypothetical protein
MSYLPKPMSMATDRPVQPFAGAAVSSAPARGRGDLADWVELMEAVETLCPVWPVRDPAAGEGGYRL